MVPSRLRTERYAAVDWKVAWRRQRWRLCHSIIKQRCFFRKKKFENAHFSNNIVVYFIFDNNKIRHSNNLKFCFVLVELRFSTFRKYIYLFILAAIFWLDFFFPLLLLLTVINDVVSEIFWWKWSIKKTTFWWFR